MERSLEEQKKELQKHIWEQQQKEQQQKSYNKELAVRSAILKYLDMPEDDRFDTDKILHVSERKLQAIAQLRRSLEKEEDALEKEYQKLTQGKTLELPEELEREFADLGIHVVYGMEWLKKNGYSEKKNKELVHNHPFLPYSLVCSGKELEKLSAHAGDIYTSFPIPIVRRKNLRRNRGKLQEA